MLVGGDVSVTGWISPYIAEDNRLAKRFRSFGMDSLESSWECTDCFALSDDEATERYYSRVRQ
jgi:hypothetical protein